MLCEKMEKNAYTLAISLQLVLLAWISTTAAQLCSSPALPLFTDQGGNRRVPRLDAATVHVIPDYNITCHGNVNMWGACVEPGARHEMYNMHFMVYRPSQNGTCLILIGKNEASGLNPHGYWGKSCVGFFVPSKQQIRVHPGDVIGFYSLGREGSGVESDDSNAMTTVWSTPVSSFTGSLGAVFCFGGNLPSSTLAAPVITFEIGQPSCKHAEVTFTTSYPSLAKSARTVSETTHFTSVSSVASSNSDITTTQTPTGSTTNRQTNPSGIQLAGLAAGVAILLFILAITTAVSLLAVLRKRRRGHNRKVMTDDSHPDVSQSVQETESIGLIGTCHSRDSINEGINETDSSRPVLTVDNQLHSMSNSARTTQTNTQRPPQNSSVPFTDGDGQKSIATMPNSAYQSETVGCTPRVPGGLSPNPGDSSSQGLRAHNSNNGDTGLSNFHNIEHDTDSMIYCEPYISPTTCVVYDYPTRAHKAGLTQSPALYDTPRQLTEDNTYEYIAIHTREGNSPSDTLYQSIEEVLYESIDI